MNRATTGQRPRNGFLLQKRRHSQLGSFWGALGCLCALFLFSPAQINPAKVSPAQAQESLDDCWSVSDDRPALRQCLEDLQIKALEEMNRSYDSAAALLQEIDAITGQNSNGGIGSAQALELSQRAFELFRDLDCQVEKLQAASGTGANDFFLSCWIDRTQDRTATLHSLAGSAKGGSLPGTSWRVEDIEGQGVLAEVDSTITFDGDDKVAGEGGCNRYFGPVQIEDNKIRFENLASTQMACPEEIMAQEQRFLQALSRANSYSFALGLLLIMDESGTPILRFSQLTP